MVVEDFQILIIMPAFGYSSDWELEVQFYSLYGQKSHKLWY